MPEPFFAKTPEDFLSPKDITAVSGLAFIRGMVEGRYPGPPIGQTLGFHPIEADEGRVVFEGTPEFSVMNPLGTVHGGWYGAILDSCMACAVQTCLKAGQIYTTLEYKINIIRPIPLGKRVHAIGTAHHAGRSTGIADGKIVGAEDGKLYATGSTTCIIMTVPQA